MRLREVLVFFVLYHPIGQARPMPDFEHMSISPRIPERQTTVPQPFGLLTEQRGKVKKQRFQERVQKQMEEEEERARYHARPLTFKSPLVSNVHSPMQSIDSTF